MELKDFNITKGKLMVMLMVIMVVIAASQLSSVHTSAETKDSGNLKEQTIKELDNTIKELTFDDEFTIKDPRFEAGGMPTGNSTIPASNRGGTPRLSENADSLIYENDSTFTIEGYQQELSQDGDWIKVTPAEVDPEGVVDNSGGFDNEINTDYVWRPRNVAAGWSPYTNGYWSYTNCGWMWISYYSWGWRPYHYGRWWWSSYYGWVWSPGFIFAPAWVVWMYNDGYCGWYPISPRIRCGYGYGYGYDYGYRCHGMRYRVRHWNFCHKKDFANPLNPPVLVVDPMYNGEIIKTTKFDGTLTATNNGVKNTGPSKDEVEQASGKQITTKNIDPYTTKDVTPVKNNDGRNNGRKKDDENQNSKEYTPPNDVTGNNGKVKDNGGSNNNETTGKNDQNNTGKEQWNGNNGKQDQNTTKDNNTKGDNNTRKNDNNSKRDEEIQKEYQRKQREQKEKEEKESYTPPPTKKNPPKDTYQPPKDTYTPPKNDNPPKKDNPPPKKETYTPPPKNDNPPRKENPPPKKDNPPPKNDNGNKKGSKN